MIKLSWLPRVLWCVTDLWLSATTTEPIRSAFSSMLMDININFETDRKKNKKVPIGQAGYFFSKHPTTHSTHLRSWVIYVLTNMLR